MSRKSAPIKCRLLVPQEDGSYKDFYDLTPEEKDAFSAKCCERMGKMLNEYYNAHPDRYRKEILESGL